MFPGIPPGLYFAVLSWIDIHLLRLQKILVASGSRRGRPFMPALPFLMLILAGAVGAGLLGALTGLGGGVVLVPMLVLVFKLGLHQAMGASLVSVIATSSGAAVAYLREGYSNMRIGIFLELATTLGALCGAAATHLLPVRIVAVVFGLVLLLSAWLSFRQQGDNPAPQPAGLARTFRLSGSYPTPHGPRPYAASHVLGGFSLMWVAGVLSGLLGIGSGAIKVLAMDRVMRLPFKVSTTTSNFMIGVTAAASAGIYYRHGYMNAALDFPVMLGVLVGALLGARLLAKAQIRTLRLLFTVVIAALALEMIYQGAAGKI
jgi:uncharacterized membrane protein YfcA